MDFLPHWNTNATKPGSGTIPCHAIPSVPGLVVHKTLTAARGWEISHESSGKKLGFVGLYRDEPFKTKKAAMACAGELAGPDWTVDGDTIASGGLNGPWYTAVEKARAFVDDTPAPVRKPKAPKAPKAPKVDPATLDPKVRAVSAVKGRSLAVIPAYGRDYRSKRAVLEAIASGQDFLVSDMSSRWDGKPANLESFRQAELDTVQVRYKGLTAIAAFTF